MSTSPQPNRPPGFLRARSFVNHQPACWQTASAEARAARESAMQSLAKDERAIVEATQKIAAMQEEMAVLRRENAAIQRGGGLSLEDEGEHRTVSALQSPHHADGGNDAFSRSVNERMEYELPELLQCSRKLKLELHAMQQLTRRDLLEHFEWRRIHYEGQWVVLPSLEPHEVDRVDEAGADAIHAPQSPRSVQTQSIDAPTRFLGTNSFDVAEVDDGCRPLHIFQWRRLFVGSLWICVPSLWPEEAAIIASQLHTRLSRGAYAPGVAEMIDDMSKLAGLLEDRSEFTFIPDETITHVAMIIVVEAEVAPILAQLDFKDDEEATADLMGLARVRSGMYKGYKLSVLKVAESKIFHRHFSGYTQASAVAALAARLLHPNLLVSFGTAGGVPGRATVGDVVLADGCLFLDRLRTRDKNAFDWGLWGGGCIPTPKMSEALGLKTGILASQIGYSVTALQEDIIGKTGVACLDMEAAPIAQILNQAGVNLIALKVISNGVYPGEPKRMEAEYHDNREEVSRRATKALRDLLDYLDGKTPAQL